MCFVRARTAPPRCRTYIMGLLRAFRFVVVVVMVVVVAAVVVLIIGVVMIAVAVVV